MNFSRCTATLTVIVWLMLSLVAGVNVRGQSPQTPGANRETLISSARQIMKKVRYCALITVDSAGQSQARAMDAFAPDEQMIVWLATNPTSRKVAAIRRHPNVALYYFDREDQAYVTISGRARIVNDATEKSKHWKDEWKDFYPNRDKSYLLIAVTPIRMEVVNQKQGIIGDSVTWAPPAVTFRTRKQR